LDKPVEKAPEFTVQLQDKSVPLLEKVTFECKVTGLPEPQISWFQDGVKLEEDSKVHIENVKGVQRLTIESVAVQHQARYSCVAENVAGKAETAANLRVESESLSLFHHSLFSPSLLPLLRNTSSCELTEKQRDIDWIENTAIRIYFQLPN
jgi:hypothetical protein